jgi:hypothetical protein
MQYYIYIYIGREEGKEGEKGRRDEGKTVRRGDGETGRREEGRREEGKERTRPFLLKGSKGSGNGGGGRGFIELSETAVGDGAVAVWCPRH